MEKNHSATAASQVHAADNVATLLGETAQGSSLTIVGPAGKRNITVLEKIELGHKIAVAPILAGEPISKFGVVIGFATRRIEPGEWVHLHNCRSQLDQRSGSFDLHTGAPGDNAYA
jgi:altronate dehydratase small subunit